MLNHSIEVPEGWQLLDDFHTYLWKRFPMDRFEFIDSPTANTPEYSSTLAAHQSSAECEASTNDPFGHGRKTLDQVSEAVQEFVRVRRLAA